MCEDGFAGDDVPRTVCPSIDDNPEMPSTMDQKDSNEGAEGAGSCAHACKAQASARVEHADDGNGMCKAEYASDDAPHVIFPSIVGGYNMPGIMFGMDQRDSNSSDEVQTERCNVTAVADDASCLFRDLEIDPIMDEYWWPLRVGVMCLVNSVDERDLSLEGHRVSNAWKSRMHIAGAAAFHLDPLAGHFFSYCIIRDLFRLRNCFFCPCSVFGVQHWCCSDFGRPKRARTTNMAEEEAAQLHERRAAELKRLDPCGWRPFPMVGRPTLQSLYENALILQVRTDPDSTKHITDKTVPHGWKRGMSVVADVQEVFACARHAVIEKHEQEHEPASAEPVIEKHEQEYELAAAELPHKKQRTRVARHHIQWSLSLADRLHVHGWKKKDVFMNCQRWCLEIFDNVHADTVYRWKLDGPGGCRGRPKKITGAAAEKLTVLTHDICVSLEIMRTFFQDLCEKDGLNVKLSREWVRAFLVSIDLSFKVAAQRSGPDKVVLTKRFIMKIAFLLDEWGLDWTRTYNFDETCLCLSPTGSHGWWWKGANEKTGVSETIETGCHCLPCAHRLLPSAFSMVPLSAWCPIWPQTSG